MIFPSFDTNTPEVDIKSKLHVKSKPNFGIKVKPIKHPFSPCEQILFRKKKSESLFKEKLTILICKIHDLTYTVFGEDVTEELKAR